MDRFRASYRTSGLDLSPEVFNPAYFASDRRISAEHDMRGRSFRELLDLQARLIHEELGRTGKGHAAVRSIVDAIEMEAGKCLGRNRELLERLSKKYRLGVVSNFCGNLDVICREYGLSELLSAVVDSRIVGVEKPDPAIFRIALERIGAEAGETVFVGDNLDRDIQPAKALGMKTVWIRESEKPPSPNPQEADRTIGSLMELEGAL